MKVSSNQIDLFDDAPGYRQTPRVAPRKRRPDAASASPGDDDEAAQKLEQTGLFKVLRKLVPRPIVPRALRSYPRLAVLVDARLACNIIR